MPNTHLGRSLLLPMAVGGILFVGIIIPSASSLALESGTKKVNIRILEQARQKHLKKLYSAEGQLADVDDRGLG